MVFPTLRQWLDRLRKSQNVAPLTPLCPSLVWRHNRAQQQSTPPFPLQVCSSSIRGPVSPATKVTTRRRGPQECPSPISPIGHSMHSTTTLPPERGERKEMHFHSGKKNIKPTRKSERANKLRTFHGGDLAMVFARGQRRRERRERERGQHICCSRHHVSRPPPNEHHLTHSRLGMGRASSARRIRLPTQTSAVQGSSVYRGP